eukprot:4779266-Amphidinium_carterae.1
MSNRKAHAAVHAEEDAAVVLDYAEEEEGKGKVETPPQKKTKVELGPCFSNFASLVPETGGGTCTSRLEQDADLSSSSGVGS